MGWLSTTFPQPERHKNIPINAQWISGEGYGSWYHLQNEKEGLLLTKFSPKGEVEHRTIFLDEKNLFDLEKPYKITYPTNNVKITIVQEGKKINLKKSTLKK